jgi:hypothetical protein
MEATPRPACCMRVLCLQRCHMGSPPHGYCPYLKLAGIPNPKPQPPNPKPQTSWDSKPQTPNLKLAGIPNLKLAGIPNPVAADACVYMHASCVFVVRMHAGSSCLQRVSFSLWKMWHMAGSVPGSSCSNVCFVHMYGIASVYDYGQLVFGTRCLMHYVCRCLCWYVMLFRETLEMYVWSMATYIIVHLHTATPCAVGVACSMSPHPVGVACSMSPHAVGVACSMSPNAMLRIHSLILRFHAPVISVTQLSRPSR